MNLPIATYKLSLSAHMFLFCFYPWPYILNVSSFSRNFGNIFSIAIHVFRNLSWKIYPLSGQILITCLKCSRKRCVWDEVDWITCYTYMTSHAIWVDEIVDVMITIKYFFLNKFKIIFHFLSLYVFVYFYQYRILAGEFL